MIYEELFKNIRSQKDFERYKKFIDSRKDRVLKTSKGIHKHHIFPRSYCKKDLEYLATDKNNLVSLSAREHYIAHLMLWKAIGGKMEVAFWYMVNSRRFSNCLTSKQYERLSKEEAKRQSKRMSGKNHPLYGKHHPEETKRKISETETGKIMSEESRAKMSESRRGKKMPIFSEMYSGEGNPFYGKTHTEETKRKISEANSGTLEERIGKERADIVKSKMSSIRKGKTYEDIFGVEKAEIVKEKLRNKPPINYTPEIRKKMSESAKNRPPRTKETQEKMNQALKGKKRTEESKKRYSEAARNRPKETCPICGRMISHSLFSKHYNACKRDHENPKVKTRKGSTTNRVWIHFNDTRKLVEKEDLDNYLNSGWILGQNKKDKGLL